MMMTSMPNNGKRKTNGQSPVSISQQFLVQLSGGTHDNFVRQQSISIGRGASITSRRCQNHDPIISLASHIIGTLLGNIVQEVADCLQRRGLLSLQEIVSDLIPTSNSGKTLSASAQHIRNDHRSSRYSSNRFNVGRIYCSTLSGKCVTNEAQIRAALLVLMQHSIVSATTKQSQSATTNAQSGTNKEKKQRRNATITVYHYYPKNAIFMNRYAKFSEYIRKTIVGSTSGNTTGNDPSMPCLIMEELFLYGRLRTIDLIMFTLNRIHSKTTTETDGAINVSNLRQNVVDTFKKLVTLGFIIQQKSSVLVNDIDDIENDVEYEWNDKLTATSSCDDDRHLHQRKRIKLSAPEIDFETATQYKGEAKNIVQVLSTDVLRNILPINAVWVANIPMFHDNLRAYYFGKYISERYGHNFSRKRSSSENTTSSSFSCIGSLITAALKYRAYRTYMSDPHKLDNNISHFAVTDMMHYIPNSVLQMLERTNQNNAESIVQQIFCDACAMDYHPHFIRRISDQSHIRQSKQITSEHNQPITFEVLIPTISNDYIDRILYQIIYDRHGSIAARVLSILSTKGYLESDRLAEMAMVPAKDIREVLHHLYRSRYIELLQLSNSSRQQYNNPNNTIYLWGVERSRLMQRMIDDVAKALYNIRVRRQHEFENTGTKWIELMATKQHNLLNDMNDAHENGNVTEIDQENYMKFCIGLERLDVASIQLDETLMALCDFPKTIVSE
jgi:hypothetical protein